MKLFLARHGNTFEKGETPRIVGRNEDLKLTAKGEEQASSLAAFLLLKEYDADFVRCGGLQRTLRTAQIIAHNCQMPTPEIDARLTEIDYGNWSGLTTDEVKERFGAKEVEDWDRFGIMPMERGWSPLRREIETNVLSFAEEALETGPNGSVLAVTSNGILRFFSLLVDGLWEQLADKGELKVGTGNLCCLEHDGAKWHMLFWNRQP